jgi:hypothetical protein
LIEYTIIYGKLFFKVVRKGMSDNKNDTLKPASHKKSSGSKDADDHINTEYDKAFKDTQQNKVSPKSKQEPASSVAIPKNNKLSHHHAMSPEERKAFLKQQALNRREQRLREQRLTPRQTRNTRRTHRDKNNIDSENDCDDDISTDNHSEFDTVNIDFGNNSGNNQQGNNNDDDNHNKTIGQFHNNELDNTTDHEKNTSGLQLSRNSQDHLNFLKDFTLNCDSMNDVELTVKKAMVSDTISQMFDQFIMGMNSFSKDTKQHHVFGQGAHLCQKILIALKHNHMLDAKTLIQKIIPKSKKNA